MKGFRKSPVALVLLWFAVAAPAGRAAAQDAPPIRGSTTVPANSLVVLSVEAVGDAAVSWRVAPAVGLTGAVTRAPNQPPGQLVFNAPPGAYRVEALVIDWGKRTVVEASATVTIGGAAPPPVDPPPALGKLFFVIVRPAQADDEYRRVMALPAWAELRAAGHARKDYTVSTLPPGVSVPDGTKLPAVVTLRAAGDKWTPVPGTVPLPTTDDGVRKLLKGGAP